MAVTYTTLNIGRASTTATFTVGTGNTSPFTVRGNLGAIVSPIDLVLETEAGEYFTLESGDFLAFA